MSNSIIKDLTSIGVSLNVTWKKIITLRSRYPGIEESQRYQNLNAAAIMLDDMLKALKDEQQERPRESE